MLEYGPGAEDLRQPHGKAGLAHTDRSFDNDISWIIYIHITFGTADKRR
jgi:hypothetical protein